MQNHEIQFSVRLPGSLTQFHFHDCYQCQLLDAEGLEHWLRTMFVLVPLVEGLNL